MLNLNIGEHISWSNHTGDPNIRLYYSGIINEDVFVMTFCKNQLSVPLYYRRDIRNINIIDDEKDKKFGVEEVAKDYIRLKEYS